MISHQDRTATIKSSDGADYDVVVIGGGIYGVCAARACARQGWTVLLIEQRDYGHATTSNSLRTIHGGLRYLQHADLPRMRQSIKERRLLMRLFPDLIKPLAFNLPLSNSGIERSWLFRIALAANDVIGLDRNQAVQTGNRLPAGRVLKKQLIVTRDSAKLSHVARWFDGFSVAPHQIVLRFLFDFLANGGTAINFCRLESLELGQEHQSQRLTATDVISGKKLSFKARGVINCAGPEIDVVSRSLSQSVSKTLFTPSYAFNLVVTRRMVEEAVGVPLESQHRDEDNLLRVGRKTLFLMPWGEKTLVGTEHRTYASEFDKVDAVRRLLAELNAALDTQAIRLQDISWVYIGLLPARDQGGDNVTLAKHPIVETQAGSVPIVSVAGVKWTTARLVAEQACKRLAETAGFRYRKRREMAPLSAGDLGATLGCYASSHATNLRSHENVENCATSPDKSADMCSDSALHLDGIRDHCRVAGAQDLVSMITVRTDLCTEAWFAPHHIKQVADVMTAELGWTDDWAQQQYTFAIRSLADRVPWQQRWCDELTRLERLENA